MSLLQTIIENGLVIQIAIGIILIEMIAVLWLRRKAGVAVLIGLLPGLCLMIALLASLTGGDWRIIALLMTVSLPFHLIDLGLRLRR
jgi:hypothetical protein